MDFEVDGDGLFKHNDTYEYDSNYEYKDEVAVGEVPAVVLPLLYSAVLLVGLLGNGLVLTTLFRKRRSWSMSDTFVLHLCIADVLLLLTLPLRTAQALQHSRGNAFGFSPLKIATFLGRGESESDFEKMVNFYCGIFLLGCIVLDCYLSCCRATKFYSAGRPILAHVTCLCVWICSLLLVTPKWIFVAASNGPGNDKTLCFETYSASSSVGQLVSRLFHHMLGFLLPAAVLIICCSCVALRLHSSSAELQKQRAFTVISCLVAVFLLCWTPYNITLMVDTLRGRSEETGNSQETPVMVTSEFGYIHTCLRPLVYLSLSADFRTQAVALLRCTPAEPVASLWRLGVVGSIFLLNEYAIFQNDLKQSTEFLTLCLHIIVRHKRT
uniref:Chemokine (C-X-C motif) receptor 3, tandem duplicate 3 n=1 Tax=Takifugu rubripes TaxID=31033 RepID=A0A674PC01_TAKRU